MALFAGSIAPDVVTFSTLIASAREWGADILVTSGGASVGVHDLVHPQQPLAKLPAGVQVREILLSESLFDEQCHRKRIPDGDTIDEDRPLGAADGLPRKSNHAL